MTSLKNILEKQDEIKALIQQFGYSDTVKIYNGDNDSKKLKLVVYEINKNSPLSENILGFLEAKLTHLLDCDVFLLSYERLPKLSVYDVDDKSINLSDQAGLIELFETKNLNEVTFEKVEGSQKVYYQLTLTQAQEYLEKKNATETSPVSATSSTSSLKSHSTLFTDPIGNCKKRPSPSGSPNSKEKKAKSAMNQKVEVDSSSGVIKLTTLISDEALLSALSKPKACKELLKKFHQILSEMKTKQEETSSDTEAKKNMPSP